MSERFDVVVIGAGQAGKPFASACAGMGRKTALIEREHIGGTCINVGCTPTKTMVASARAAYLSRRGADYGVRLDGLAIDMARVRERKRAMVESFRGYGQRRLERTPNLSLIFGEARFSGARVLDVTTREGARRELAAETVVINVGCRPAVPALPGLREVPWLDSTSIMELDEVPDHLVVLGGGYIGLEFGQMFRRFGSRVTIVQRGPQLLPREDEDVAAEVARILREDGIDIRLHTEASSVARAGGGLDLTVSGPEGTGRIVGSHLLTAAGRTPNTDTLNAASAGVKLDARGFVEANGRLETTAPGVYAAGDVVGGPMFTHISYDDFRVLRENLLRGGDATTAGRLVPYTVFIDPELAHVGLSERDAKGSGRPYRVARLPMTGVARALEMGEARGFMKTVVDPDSWRILGFTVLGVGGGELMSIVEVAMIGGLPYAALRDAIFVHPTMAECLNNLYAQLEG